ncbi:MAG: GNAT family N-acetyltransferase [Anaerolineae bacterium]|nr:GNAT family N-acetyltransferase [Anaerolineae bacterium]
MTDSSLSIRYLEEISMTALPALHTVYYDGWVLRFAGGHTRRANSVNALYPSTLDLDEKIAHCADLYRGQGLPVVFKMTDAVIPSDLDAQLEARGFALAAPTSVQVADLRNFSLEESKSAVITSERSPRWLEAYAQMNEVPAYRRDLLGRMLDGVLTPIGYATIEQGGATAAVGLGVVAHGYVGLFDIVTAPHLRQQGFGRRIVMSLLRWGQSQGAHTAYLQVVAENTPAVSLYQKVGFREFYRYWYRAL